MKPRRRSSVSRLPWRLASERRATHSVAVAKATRWPARQARMEMAMARWVLPVPGGPNRTTLSLAWRKSSWPRCSTTWRRTERWKEVELLERLSGREAGGLDPRLAAVALARGDLGCEHRLEEALVAPLLLAGPLGQLRRRPGRGRRLQRPE